jgi:hypothetical protein
MPNGAKNGARANNNGVAPLLLTRSIHPFRKLLQRALSVSASPHARAADGLCCVADFALPHETYLWKIEINTGIEFGK